MSITWTIYLGAQLFFTANNLWTNVWLLDRGFYYILHLIHLGGVYKAGCITFSAGCITFCVGYNKNTGFFSVVYKKSTTLKVIPHSLCSWGITFIGGGFLIHHAEKPVYLYSIMDTVVQILQRLAEKLVINFESAKCVNKPWSKTVISTCYCVVCCGNATVEKDMHSHVLPFVLQPSTLCSEK